jgi:hypothetical protein
MNNFSCIDGFVTPGLDILVICTLCAQIVTGAVLASFFMGGSRYRRGTARGDMSVFPRHGQNRSPPRPSAAGPVRWLDSVINDVNCGFAK